MTNEEAKSGFTAIMYDLFQVWDGTDNAEEILRDVCNTFGSRLFGLSGYGPSLSDFTRKCQYGVKKDAA